MDQADIKLALSVFHQPPHNANCAQSVALLAGREDLLAELRAFGGGRAPDGTCGALYAAMKLAPEDQREAIKETFKKESGATTCRELKGIGTPCANCVACAYALLNKSKK